MRAVPSCNSDDVKHMYSHGIKDYIVFGIDISSKAYQYFSDIKVIAIQCLIQWSFSNLVCIGQIYHAHSNPYHKINSKLCTLIK